MKEDVEKSKDGMIRVPAALYARLQRVRERDGRSIAWQVRRALAAYIKKGA